MIRKVLGALLLLLALPLGGTGAAAGTASPEAAEAAVRRAQSLISSAPEGPARQVAEARLADARAALAGGRPEDALVLAEEAARIAALPTARVTVVVEPGSGSRFVVREGTVEVTSGRITAVAGPGEMVTAVAGGAPRVEKIPVAPPALLTPAEGASVDWEAVLRWSKSTGARRYQVWISRDPLFRDRVSLFSAEGTTMPVDPDLETGTYWWRVTAISADGVESLPSDARSVRIAPDPDGRLYWVRHLTKGCETASCPRWLAVDAESGAERPVADVDLGLLGLDRVSAERTRQQLLGGEMAVRGSIRPGRTPERAVLVVSGVRGVQ